MDVSDRKELKGLSSTIFLGSGEDFDLICQPCDRDDLRLPAFGFCRECQEHLCESCFNYHKRAKPSRHHILVDKQQMPQTQLSTSVPSNQSDDLTKPCPKHTKEAIKFYCHDHRELICSVCVTLEHTRTACRINYIPDISEQSLNSKEYGHMLTSMHILTQKCHEITTDIKQLTAKSSTSLTDALAEIRKFRHTINQRLDELEKLVEDKAKVIQQDNTTRFQKAEAICNEVIKSLKVSADVIRQLNTSKQADRLFMELQYAEKIIQENEKRLPSPNDFKEYNFQPSAEISTCLKNEKCLGTLIQKAIKPTITSSAGALKSDQFSHQGAINVNTPQEKKECWISGMAFIIPSKLIITDYRNKSVKMFDINSNSITDHLKLEKNPFEITAVTRDELAVTLPSKHSSIQFISVSSNKLSLKHDMKVDGECWGISCHQEKLVVTFIDPPQLRIIDLKNKVQRKFTKNSSGEDIFDRPFHVTSNSSAIYIADERKGKVLMFNWRGELRGSYNAVDEPRGITVSEDGSVFVSAYRKDNIHHISCDLTKGKIVLKDLKRPYAVCWCDGNSQLYIGTFTANDNFIQVFKKI